MCQVILLSSNYTKRSVCNPRLISSAHVCRCLIIKPGYWFPFLPAINITVFFMSITAKRRECYYVHHYKKRIYKPLCSTGAKGQNFSYYISIITKKRIFKPLIMSIIAKMEILHPLCSILQKWKFFYPLCPYYCKNGNFPPIIFIFAKMEYFTPLCPLLQNGNFNIYVKYCKNREFQLFNN